MTMATLRIRKLLLAVPIFGLFAADYQGQETSRSTTDDFERRLQDLERRYALDIDDLLFEIELLNERLDSGSERVPDVRSPNVLNPKIAVLGTMLARTDDRSVLNAGGMDIDDSIRLSEVELDFRSAIDPWADGVIIAAFESDVAGEYEATIEEGYVLLKKLPFTETAPAGLRLKVGRFRTAFGRINRVHTHNLPWGTRPLAVQQFLGEEGYLREGISGSFQIPISSPSDSIDLTLQLLAGGEIPFDSTAAASEHASLGHISWFRELKDEHSMELGFSARGGDSDRMLYGADFTYTWKPLQGGQWRSFLFGGEVFLNDSDTIDLDRARGGFMWSQYQLDRNLYLGVRYDLVEELDDRSIDTSRIGLWLSCYSTDFMRLRLGLEHTESDLIGLDGLDTGFVELSFVFGSHPAEPYWVNR